MKEHTKTTALPLGAWVLQKVQDYKEAIKFRLTITVVFSSVMAFLIASIGAINWQSVLILAMGGFFVTGAANIFNQVLEKDFDILMTRTQNRPIATGRMTVLEAVVAVGIMSIVGIAFLALFNPWTAILGMVALVSYAFIYTPLKRVSPIAIFVGALPGALPMVIGCAAAEGRLTLLGLSLFILQFLWQFPHSWSIGYLGFEDYKKAGFKFMPEVNGMLDRSAGLQSLLYSLFLIPVCVLPWFLGATGFATAILAVLLSVGFSFFAWTFYKKYTRKSALVLMFYSIAYIPLVLIIFFLDKLG